eukprot:1194651-Prorocentrum_minimum.AAC.13
MQPRHARVSICDDGIVFSLARCALRRTSLPQDVRMIEADLIYRPLSTGGFRAPGGGICEGQEHEEH